MFFSSRKYCGGFTYLAALIMIMVMGIMLGAVGQSWSGLMKREREEELFFRGNQIQKAITQYYTAPKTPGGEPRHVVVPLNDIKDLVKDPKGQKLHWLRQEYTDPVTGKKWVPIRGDVKGKGTMKGIICVVSSSDEKPIRQSGFPDEYKMFEGKTKYSEWKFCYGTPPVSLNISTDPNLSDPTTTGLTTTDPTTTGSTSTGSTPAGSRSTGSRSTGSTNTDPNLSDPITTGWTPTGARSTGTTSTGTTTTGTTTTGTTSTGTTSTGTTSTGTTSTGSTTTDPTISDPIWNRRNESSGG